MANQFISNPAAYVGQTYTPLYVSLNGTPNTEVQKISVKRSDGGAPAETIMRGWAGRFSGAPKATCTLSGLVPNTPQAGDSTTGSGFNNSGMTAGGISLDQTMLTFLNATNNTPVSFLIQIGGNKAQQLAFKGYVIDIDVDYSLGGQTTFNCQVEGNFSTFQ